MDECRAIRQSVRVDSPAARLNWLQHQYVHHGWRSAVLQSVVVSVLLWIVMPFFVEDVSRSIGRLAAWVLAGVVVSPLTYFFSIRPVRLRSRDLESE